MEFQKDMFQSLDLKFSLSDYKGHSHFIMLGCSYSVPPSEFVCSFANLWHSKCHHLQNNKRHILIQDFFLMLL